MVLHLHPAKANIETHDLVKTGDPEAHGPIVDRNGEVVLAYCRRCKGGESDLYDESCLTRLMKKNIEENAKLPPLERALNEARSRRSWVVGECMMTDQGAPNGVSYEEALARYEKITEGALLAELERRIILDDQKIEPSHKGGDGTERKDHYGAGRQPWDDFKDWGWAAKFAAACVIKYLRRTKADPNDIPDARWYYRELARLANEPLYTRGDEDIPDPRDNATIEACNVFIDLLKKLTPDEFDKIKDAGP